MDSLKYIKYKESEYGLEQMVIFLPIDSHDDMARKLKIPKGMIISAGFFSCDPNSIRCYGKSVTLHVGSLGEEDAYKIKRVINGY